MLAPSEYESGAARGYLDTATYGLPPRSVVAAVERALAGWQTRASWLEWEADAERCRDLFAAIVGAEATDVAMTTSVSVAAGLVAASLPAGEGDNVVVHESDFASNLFPWTALERRGVQVRALALDELETGIDERTALVAVSAVQSADGRVGDLTVLNGHVGSLTPDMPAADDVRGGHGPVPGTGPRLFVDATHAVGAIPIDVRGVDYLACSAYKWIPAPRGLSFLYVRPERLGEIEPWLAGWKSRVDWQNRYYGLPPELWEDARRLDTSLPWLVAAGARPALELVAELGADAVSRHDLRLARRFAAELSIPAPASPIVRFGVADAERALARLEAAGVSASVRSGAVRLSFHLSNDDEDVDLALDALAPVAAGTAESAHGA